jgi:hypothetical protein
MLLCGIYNITLLSCRFGNCMVQHNDRLIHKQLSNAWSCMTDDEFCVFWSKAKQRRQMKFGRREDQQNGKKTIRLGPKSLSQAPTDATSCGTYTDAPSNWYSVFIFIIRSFACSQRFGMCRTTNHGPTSSPLIECCIVWLNFAHHGYLFIYFCSFFCG